MILHIENPKEFTHTHTHRHTHKTMRTNKQVSQGCKIQDRCIKSTAFLYTTNKQSKHKVKNIIPFTTTSKRMKYLGINLTKEVLRLAL